MPSMILTVRASFRITAGSPHRGEREFTMNAGVSEPVGQVLARAAMLAQQNIAKEFCTPRTLVALSGVTVAEYEEGN